MDDERAMVQAVELAWRCPASDSAFSVGAVIADGADVIARGYSRQEQPGDHAEEVALRHAAQHAAQDLSGATMYSSLEPCGQRASRPTPCAQLIISAGIRRVVFAWSEPATFVSACGESVLRQAGLEVVVLADWAARAAAPNAHLSPGGHQRGPQ